MLRRLLGMVSIFGKGDSALEINAALKRGKALEQSGKLKEARELYKKLVVDNPGCKACRAHYGRTHGEEEVISNTP